MDTDDDHNQTSTANYSGVSIQVCDDTFVIGITVQLLNLFIAIYRYHLTARPTRD
jgi:hypothetical protein